MDGLLLVLVDRVKELLGRFPPCSEMVLVEHHEVPVFYAHPLVPGLDISVGISTEIVLERAKADDRALGIAVLILLAAATDELPALEVDMAV